MKKEDLDDLKDLIETIKKDLDEMNDMLGYLTGGIVRVKHGLTMIKAKLDLIYEKEGDETKVKASKGMED